MVTTIEQIEGLSKRLDKARQIVSDAMVFPVVGMSEHYVVQASDGNSFYLISDTCTCPDANERSELHKGWCKHRLAVELFKKEHEESSSSKQIKDDVESLYGSQESHRLSVETNTDGSSKNTHKGASHEQ